MLDAAVQALRDVESLSRAVYSVALEVVAEIESRGIAAREGSHHRLPSVGEGQLGTTSSTSGRS